MMHKYLFAALVCAAVGLSADPWPTAKPEDVGFRQDKLDAVTEYARQNTPTTAIVAAVGGKIIYTYGDIRQVSYIASCRKSVLSMLYGKYVENGTVKLDEMIGDLGIDDVGGLLPEEKTATVYDIITARSGVYHPAANAGGNPSEPKFVRGATKPGTRFVYNNWDFNVAGTIFTMKTGLAIFDAFERDLAVPLGMEDFDRKRHKLGGDANASKHLAYHFHLSTRDMARLGQLMLQKGRWNGVQLVPEAWVKRSTTVVSPGKKITPDFRRGYGIMWWILASEKYSEQFAGGYTAKGMYGQYITVLPAMDLVVAHKTAVGNGKKRTTTAAQYGRILRMIVEAGLPPAKTDGNTVRPAVQNR